MPTIDIYPSCPKPPWLKVGTICCCLGEGYDEFVVETIADDAAFLMTGRRHGHGWESFTKLFRPGMMDVDLPSTVKPQVKKRHHK